MKNIFKPVIICTYLLLLITLSVRNAEGATVAKETRNGYEISVTQTKGKTVIKWNGKPIHTYNFSGKVRIIASNKLTAKMLKRRKNKVLYIERITGYVTDKKLNGVTTTGHYISYKSLRGKVRPGTKVITYCLYNPFTKWVDDIDEVYEFPVK